MGKIPVFDPVEINAKLGSSVGNPESGLCPIPWGGEVVC
ncbi:MAG: hypothetical protein ACJAQ8_001793 [Haliea salexigens]|jgi:hypothetical protein